MSIVTTPHLFVLELIHNYACHRRQLFVLLLQQLLLIPLNEPSLRSLTSIPSPRQVKFVKAIGLTISRAQAVPRKCRSRAASSSIKLRLPLRVRPPLRPWSPVSAAISSLDR